MDDENPIPVSHFIQGVYTVIKATKYCNSLCGVYRTGGEGLEDSQKECLGENNNFLKWCVKTLI